MLQPAFLICILISRLQVLSSIVAAWSDITTAFQNSFPDYAGAHPILRVDPAQAHKSLANTGAGYVWMGFNCLTTATYVSNFAFEVYAVEFRLRAGVDYEKKDQVYGIQGLGHDVL
jgi:hypothetical protein